MQFSKSEAETAAALERLGLTAEEIEQTILDDRQINQGAKLFELSDEQKGASKKARATGTRKATPTERKRKEDEIKRFLIRLFEEALEEHAHEIVVTNIERQIDFEYQDRRFRIILSAPRK